MKLVHEAVIEGGEIFETLGARFFEPFEEEDLGARVDLFQELAQLGHGVAAGWDTEDIVHEALDELLRVNPEDWEAEMEDSRQFLSKFGARLPRQIGGEHCGK